MLSLSLIRINLIVSRIFSPQVFLIGLLVFGSSCLPTYACENGNPESTSYIRRDNNRCEGIVRQLSGESSTGLFRIISLVIGTITSFGSDLTLNFPHLGSGTIELRVQSLKANYLLDDVNFAPGSSSFRVPTKVLKQAQVPTDSLRTLAWVSSGINVVYVPVILEQKSSEYQFVFFTRGAASFPKLEIVRVKDGQIVYSKPRLYPQSAGEVFVNWDGHKQPPGRYELRITALQEQVGKPPKQLSQNITFEHNPGWFR